jgi:hypothetical protein
MITNKVVDTEMYIAINGNSEFFFTILYAVTVNTPFVLLTLHSNLSSCQTFWDKGCSFFAVTIHIQSCKLFRIMGIVSI